jgi:hypothetical protein
MVNKNIIYGGAGVIGCGVLYFLYSKFSNNDSRQSSDDKTNYDYEAWTGSLPKAMNWGGGKSKKNKKSNKKSKKNK